MRVGPGRNMDKPRSVVLVIAPESLLQSSRSRTTQVTPHRRPLSDSGSTGSTHNEAHNRIERQRKDRIRRGIKQLSEILKPPCHCGKATSAEVLQKVVDQITTLQKENEELKQQIAQLSSPRSGDESEVRGRLTELLLEQVLLKALLLGHQGSATLTSVATETFTAPELQTIGREEETWGEGEDEGSERDGAQGSDSAHRSREDRVQQQQPWPITSLLSLEDNPRTQNELPVSVVPPCSLASAHSEASSSSLSHHSTVATFSLPPSGQPLSTSLPTSASSHVLVGSEALQPTPPPLPLASSPWPNTPLPPLPPPNCVPPSSQPSTIVQPWVDASPHLTHQPFSSSQAQHSSSPYSHSQQDLFPADIPQATHPTTTTTTSAGGGRSRDRPLQRERSLRFRPYQPPPAPPRTRGLSSPTQGHSGRSYRLTIHAPLTSSDFPRVQRMPRQHNLNGPSSNCSPTSYSPSEQRYSNDVPPPPPYYNPEQTLLPHLQPPPPSLPSSHPAYPPPPPPAQTQNATVWRPYSERTRGSGFCLADIISLPPSGEVTENGLQLSPSPLPPPTTNPPGRIPSFLVDHLLDDTGI